MSEPTHVALGSEPVFTAFGVSGRRFDWAYRRLNTEYFRMRGRLGRVLDVPLTYRSFGGLPLRNGAHDLQPGRFMPFVAWQVAVASSTPESSTLTQ